MNPGACASNLNIMKTKAATAWWEGEGGFGWDTGGCPPLALLPEIQPHPSHLQVLYHWIGPCMIAQCTAVCLRYIPFQLVS